MNLSDIIQYRNNLRDIIKDDGLTPVDQILGPILHSIENSDLQIGDLTDDLRSEFQSTKNNIKSFYEIVNQILIGIDRCIAEMQPAYFARSYQLYDQEMRNDSTEHILNRRFTLNQSAEIYITARIQGHSNWKYPGMIIRPGLEEWEDKLVGLDPLYLVDQTHELLEPIRKKFNRDYQRRLRYYTINEDEDVILKNLPENQLSFCLAYNFFNSKPLEVIKKYMTEIYELLRPGGTFAFTFIDGDRPGGVRLVERNFVCYTPEGLLKNLAISLGYEIIQMYHIDAANTWLEVKKPGELTSLRGGQSLARVVAKSK